MSRNGQLSPTLTAYQQGYRYMLDLFNIGGGRMTPEWETTRKGAIVRRKELRKAGITATIFKIDETGKCLQI